jgi:glycosyltransferase involved in cell wall biosynthesis
MAEPLSINAHNPTPVACEQVLHVVDADIAARFGPMIAQAAQGIAAAGVGTAVLTDDPRWGAKFATTAVECHVRPRWDGWHGWDLAGWLDAHVKPAPNIVHVWGVGGLRWLERWTRRNDMPLVIHACGTEHTSRLQRDGAEVVSASLALSELLRDQYRLTAEHCRTILPAINAPADAPWPAGGDHVLSVLCVSQLGEHRGLELLIDAVAQLRRTGCDLQLALIGAAAKVDVIWRRIRDRQVRECVSLIDEPGLWEQVLPEVDACIVPARQTELSIVPLMAMGLGKVVIASRDQLAEWFIEDRTAWQFTPGSAVELAYLLTRAIEQPGAARELTGSARDYVREHHAVPRMVEALLALYETLAAGREHATQPGQTERNGGRDGA